jgi:transposase
MLTLATANMRIYFHTQPTDMRKSFDGLSGLVRSVFRADPLDGSLFLFINRRCDRVKMLWWDRDGLALFYKRLESGTFEMLKADGEATTIEIDATQLAMLLGGVTLDSAKRRKRYARAG